VQLGTELELVEHLKQNSLRSGGRFVLRSGEVSSWYLEGRNTTFDGRGALLVGRAVLAVLDPDVDVVGGMTQGADPVALACAMVGALEGRSLRAFSVRKEEKTHGTGGRLVGPVRAGDRAAVVEDTSTTGGALLEVLDVLADAGVEVIQVVVVADRSGGRVAELLAARRLPYRALVTPPDLGVEG
jgi:orotate phosphoribosyltransferase